MAYLGNDLQVAFPSYRNIDDISGSFNGVTTSFTLTVDGVAPIPAPVNSQQCLISVNGIVQRPDDSGTEGFRLSGGNIIFASAPAGGVDFFGVILAGADYVNVGANFPSGTASAPSITFDSDLDTGIYNPAGNEIGFTTGGTRRLVINSSGQISSGLGTAAAPAFSFISDPNTGVYSPGADQLALSTNGTGRLFVDASGNVGVGASPVVSFAGQTHLTVNHSSGGTTVAGINLATDGTKRASLITYPSNSEALRITAESTTLPITVHTNSSERLRITSAGLVGIGTSSPSAKLTITDSATPYIRIERPATPTWQIQNNLITTEYGFSVNNVSSGTTPFFIGNSGNVGIGTTSPGRSLHIAGGTNSLVIERTDTTTSALLCVAGSNQTEIYSRATNSSATARDLAIHVGSSEAARIDSSGRLLVGTSSQSNSSLFTIKGNSSNSAGASEITLQRGEAATSITSGESLGHLYFTDNSSNKFAEIAAWSDAAAGSGDYPGRLVFSTTADGASSPTPALLIRQNGTLEADPTYANTTANAANMHIDSIGFIYRSTSSLKYKSDVETLQDSYADAILGVRPVWYRSTCEGDCREHSWWGFIAEEVAAIDPRLVQWKTVEVSHDEDGNTIKTPCDPEPDGVAYERFVPLLLNLIKRQKEQIEAMEARLTAAGI